MKALSPPSVFKIKSHQNGLPNHFDFDNLILAKLLFTELTPLIKIHVDSTRIIYNFLHNFYKGRKLDKE